jgi:hypothetical protein
MDEILKIENRKKDKARKKYEEEQRIINEELQKYLKQAEELR